MQTLDQALEKLVEAKLVTLSEAMKTAHKPDELRAKYTYGRSSTKMYVGVLVCPHILYL